MNNRLRYWLIMGLSVPLQQQKKKKIQTKQKGEWSVSGGPLCESCHTFHNQVQNTAEGTTRDGPTLKEPLNKMRLEPPPFPRLLTSTYQSCIVNLKYGLVITELLYQLDVLYCFEIG